MKKPQEKKKKWHNRLTTGKVLLGAGMAGSALMGAGLLLASGRRGLSGGGVSKAANTVTTMGNASKAQTKTAPGLAVKNVKKAKDRAYKEAAKKTTQGPSKYETEEDIRKKLDDPNHVWKF